MPLSIKITNGSTPNALRLALLTLLLSACGTPPVAPVIDRDANVRPSRTEAAPPRTPPPAEATSSARRPGAFYKDDGPGDNPPPDLDKVADAQPRVEPLHRFANNPYNVFGKDYTPMRAVTPFRQNGIGSWYGKKFHGQKTSSGEVYDMYAMTAAHPTLPIPSYARVTNQMNGRSVLVRVNDRGPFHAGRVVDLSFAAAFKLGYVIQGSAPVQVELLQPEEIARLTAAAPRVAAVTPPTTNAAPTPSPAPATNTPPATVATSTPIAPPPTISPPVSIAPPASAEVLTGPNVYLQLGAFSARDNAENFRARVYRDLTWLNDAIEILPREGLFRLHLGPYRDRAQAATMAERLRRDIDLNPVYVTR